MNKSIGMRIQELREKQNLSQRELAQLLNCASNTVNEWERREGRSPGKRIIGKVAEILNVSTDYLLEGKKNLPEIPCYGEIESENFTWSENNKEKYKIFISEKNPFKDVFCFKIKDEILKPVINKNEYAIFKKGTLEDGDIVILRFKDKDKALIRYWREKDGVAMADGTNLLKICSPLFLKIKNGKKYQTFRGETLYVEGKLVAVKQAINYRKFSEKIKYIE